MRVSSACSPPVLPVNGPATLDVLITFHAEAPAGPRPPRRPLNLSVVIDRSGSMAGDPLKQAIKAAEALVERLGPSDVLSVLAYDDSVWTVVEPDLVGDKRAICQQIRKIQDAGATNLSAGWLKGCEYVLARRGGATIDRVLLLTDGQANKGVTKSDVLIKTAREKAEAKPGGAVVVAMGDAFRGEDKTLAIEVAIPGQKETRAALPLFSASYTFEEVTDDGIRPAGAQTPLTVTVPVVSTVQAAKIGSDAEVLVRISRIRIARAKDAAIGQSDRGDRGGAAETLRRAIEDLRANGLDEWFEIAEEIAQLEHFAAGIEKGRFDAAGRKEMRDQSYQARARGRSDLAQRGVAGGSARDLDPVRTVEGGVELACYREGGKLRMRVVSDGYDPAFNVQFPRSIREEGVHYVVDALQPSADGTFYRATGKIRRLVLPGQEDRYKTAAPKSGGGAPKASKISARTAADLEATDSVGTGVLVQCIKEGSKLRARVVSDGYDPDYNMRFPRDIREEGTLYVVDQVIEASGGSSYIACGKIRRLVQ